jgi:hypothetical protein
MPFSQRFYVAKTPCNPDDRTPNRARRMPPQLAESMPREKRGAVLAAFREIYDGRWVRSVGSEGGQTLE